MREAALLHYHIPEMRDVVIVDIPKMQTAMFVISNPKNILIVGSLSQAMLSRVPVDRPIIVEYLKTAVSTGDVGSESIHEEEPPMKKAKDFKRIGKTIVSNKSKKQNNSRVSQVVFEDESSEHTTSLYHNVKESAFNHEEDSTNIRLKSTIILVPIQTPHVSSYMESEAEIFKQFSTKPFEISIFTEATSVSQTTTYTELPPDTSTFKSHREENRTSGIPEFTSTPPITNDFEEEILMNDDCKSNDEFVATGFSFQVESDDDDDDDAPMTKGDFCKLNKKLDELLPQSSTSMNTKYEELFSSHQETIKKLVQDNANKISQYKKFVDESTQLVKEANKGNVKIVSEKIDDLNRR
ncbi:unnamed protein product [Lactuca virosa]|uniref:Uncharacterized protein n=1 Tax=Lactuca virosa TaxID=75947 RepID=A0AAU9MR77_9ASTR|nr:unnamed protein product [Lactuca virosa]